MAEPHQQRPTPTVVHFLVDPRIGGPLVIARSLREHIREYPTVMVTTGRGEITDVELAIIRRPFRAMFALELLVNIVQIAWLTQRLLRRTPLIFHIHGSANTAPAFVACLFGVPVVWHVHEPRPDGQTLIHPFAVWAFRQVRTLAAGMVTSWLPHRWVCAAENARDSHGLKGAPGVTVINSPLDAERWQRAADAVPFADTAGGAGVSGAERRFRLVAVGQLYILKGQDLLLDALAQPGLEDVEVAFIGEELETKRWYADRLRAHSVTQQGRVTFLGGMSADEIIASVPRYDAFVLPSRIETSSIAMLEAMALEMPCVGSTAGAVADMMEDGAGVGVTPGDVGELAAAIRRLLAMTAEERAELGRRARRRVIERFSAATIADRHRENYRALEEAALATHGRFRVSVNSR